MTLQALPRTLKAKEKFVKKQYMLGEVSKLFVNHVWFIRVTPELQPKVSLTFKIMFSYAINLEIHYHECFSSHILQYHLEKL